MASKNTLILFLVFTAALLCYVLVTSAGPRITSTTGIVDRGGNYVVAATSSGFRDWDLLWVCDTKSQLLVLYGADINGRIVPLTYTDLRLIFVPLSPAQEQPVFPPVAPPTPQLPVPIPPQTTPERSSAPQPPSPR